MKFLNEEKANILLNIGLGTLYILIGITFLPLLAVLLLCEKLHIINV